MPVVILELATLTKRSIQNPGNLVVPKLNLFYTMSESEMFHTMLVIVWVRSVLATSNR